MYSQTLTPEQHLKLLIENSGKLRFNRPIELHIGVGEVSPEGQLAIKEYITSATGFDKWFRLDGFEWKWVTKRGTLPKRLSSHLYKQKVRLNTSHLSHVGTLASQHTVKENSYVFAFDSTLDWNAGDFGDDSSCVMNRPTSAVYSLKAYGVYAMRFYESLDQYTKHNGNVGVGRAFFKIFPNYVLLFNGYGYDTIIAARVLSTYLGLTYYSTPISNQKNNEVYVNGKGHGYIISTQDLISSHKREPLVLDLGVGCQHSPQSVTCCRCGHQKYSLLPPFTASSTVFMDPGKGLNNTVYVCTRCARLLFPTDTCSVCRKAEPCLPVYSNTPPQPRLACVECIKSLKIGVCFMCGNSFTDVGGDGFLCPSCSEQPRYCTNCHKTTVNPINRQNRGRVCLMCYMELHPRPGQQWIRFIQENLGVDAELAKGLLRLLNAGVLND